MMMMTQYKVTGMSCAACSARVEKAVAAVSGVDSVAVSLLTNSMGVEGTASPADVIAAVKKAGYGAELKSGTAHSDSRDFSASADAAAVAGDERYKDTETPRLLRRLMISLLLLIPLMYVSMGHMMWGWRLPSFLDGNHVAMGLCQLLLTVAIMVTNKKFFESGYTALWHRAPNMDTLVALGATAAFAYSTVALFAMTSAQIAGGNEAAMAYMDEFYFESAATILTLITLGKMLEARSKGKTTDALRSLLSLAPKTANVIRDGVEVTVPASEVRVGDIFVVRPGEQIPTDGTVTDGASAVDESSLTGESIPVDKAAGDNVFSGTLNRSGFITCTATRVGDDTTLSQIIRMVEDSAATKAPIARIADRVSGVFVPTVIAIAAVTITVWLLTGATTGFALARGISVLVISCPCALGLATPVAIMVGSGVGAKNGILYKTAASLEAMGRVEIAALDKTGTITAGQPRVTDIIPAPGATENELLTLAYSLEIKSEHPLARAIVDDAEKKGVAPLPVSDFEALPGNGLAASIDENRIVGGSIAYIGTMSAIPDELRARADTLASEGKTPLAFASVSKQPRQGRMLGIIAVADVIRDDSAAAIAELKALGIRTVMLTGDNERTARAIAKSAGVDDVIAGVLPDGKESVIRELKTKGKTIMVGDGINDAPALTSADVGIAVSNGTDVAIESSEVVLMKPSLSGVPAAIRLGRATLRNIRENLFWAFIYNVIGIPLAAGVFIPLFGWQLDPMYGALAMSLSSFCVVTNALRLNLCRPYKVKNKSHKEEKQMNTLKIKGMMCGHCEARVKSALEAVPGVTSAEVSHKKGTAVVSGTADRDALIAAVKAAGYEVVG